MDQKYIIVKHADKEVPIVFSSLLPHDRVAGKNQVQSAGFCERDPAGNWVAKGWSDSLNVGARSKDAEILNAYL